MTEAELMKGIVDFWYWAMAVVCLTGSFLFRHRR